jgi:hypothetical protein
MPKNNESIDWAIKFIVKRFKELDGMFLSDLTTYEKKIYKEGVRLGFLVAGNDDEITFCNDMTLTLE